MRKLLLLLLAFLPLPLFGQGVMSQPQVALKTVNGLTTPIANATITVCAALTGGIPCSPALTSTIFKDVALTQPLSNPFTTDSSGNYQFAAAANTYTVTVTASGFSGYSYQLSLSNGSGSGTGLSGLTPGQVPIANTSTTANSSKAIQGSDTSLLSAGLITSTPGVTICSDSNGGATTTGCSATTGVIFSSPSGAQTITQPVSGTGTTAFNVNNLSNVRYVTPAYNWSYTDSGGSLGNLGTAGTNLTITLPANGSTSCPSGIDTTFGGFTLSGTGSISASGTTVTMTSAVMFPNYVSLPISIPNAGPGNTTLKATIVSWTDSTHVVISTAATNTVSGQTVTVGSYLYTVLISGTGTTEAAPVIGGAAAPGATSNCTLVVNTQFNHPNGYTVSSASGGIQEAINDAWVSNTPSTAATSAAPYIKLMAGTQYNINGTVYVRGYGATIDATGALIGCYTRNYCTFWGDWKGHPDISGQRFINPLFAPGLSNIVGCNATTYCNVSSASATNNVFTITTSANHSFSAGANGAGADVVDCEVSTTGTIFHIAGVVQATTSNTITIANGTSGTTFSAGTYTFGFCRTLNDAIEDNTEHLVVDNLQAMQINSVNGTGTFGFVLVNENDQHLVVNAGSNRGSQVLDNTYPVSAYFLQRTDQGYAGIFNIRDYELSNVNCASFGNGSNGAIWRGGVCQGFPSFGIRYFGGLQSMTAQDIYQEAGSTTANPLYPGGIITGGAGMAYLFQGGGLGNRLLGLFPVSAIYPTFSCSGTAQAQRNYYVQALNGSGQASALLYIGSSQANCAGATINLAWPAPAGIDISNASTGAITWHLWLTTGVGTTPPTGSSNAILFNSSSPTCGSNGMCTFADTQAGTTSHSVPAVQYGIRFWFWPAPVVLNQSSGPLLEDIGSNTSGIASSAGMLKISAVALSCVAVGSLELLSPNITQCATPSPNNVAASILDQNNSAGTGPTANSMGAINFGSQSTAALDLITLADNNFFGKTLLTAGWRPVANAADVAIGTDQINGLSSRANTSISNYIGALQDNSSYKERLTSTAKTFAVPLVAAGGTPTLSGTGACATTGSQLGGKWAGSFACTGTTGASTVTITPGGTAPNGWICTVFDRTAGTTGPQTGSTTTTCTATFASVTANDVLTFQATSF